MKKQTTIILALIICLSFMFSSINPSKAVSYYNWIQNPSFEGETNLIGNGGFENGQIYVDWEFEHGNWSSYSGLGQIELTTSHSGVYSVESYYSGTEHNLCYNFSEPILGSDVIEFTFWAYGSGSGDYNIKVYYTDTTSDTSGVTDIGTGVWVECDEVSVINANKYLDYIIFDANDVYSVYFDDIYLAVYEPDSQTEKSMTSTPWFGADNYGFSYIQDGYISRDGTGSYYIGYAGYADSVCQNIEYLDSDTIHYFDLWAYTETPTPDIGIKVNIVYSDRSSASRTVNLTVQDTWTHLNFGSSFISENKYILQIQISLANYFEGYVILDDVGLWSSLPITYHRFTFSLSPSSNTQTSGSFNAYQGIQYTFNGYIWDENLTLSESGTFSVTSDTGISSGSISNGVFSFILSSRSGHNTLTETLTIRLVVSGEVIEIQIIATWEYVAGSEDEEEQQQRANNLVDWIVMFVVVFLPALLLAGGIYENNNQPDSMHISPIFGIITGLVLSIGIGIYTSLIPFWLLIIIIVAIVVLIVSMVANK